MSSTRIIPMMHVSPESTKQTRHSRPNGGPVGAGWFPASEFDTAITLWPSLTESWGEVSYEGYCHLLQQNFVNFASMGLRVGLVKLIITDYCQWCSAKGLDAGSSQARSQYAAAQAQRGKCIAWPPGRNDPCWCGSGRKYKQCCGTITTPHRENE